MVRYVHVAVLCFEHASKSIGLLIHTELCWLTVINWERVVFALNLCCRCAVSCADYYCTLHKQQAQVRKAAM